MLDINDSMSAQSTKVCSYHTKDMLNLQPIAKKQARTHLEAGLFA